MGVQFPRVISRRYNDRILHDDEEKSEMGKGISRGYYFLASNFFSFFFFIEFTFKRLLRLLSFSFQSKSYYRFTRLMGENIFLTFFCIDIYFYKPIILLESTNHIQCD